MGGEMSGKRRRHTEEFKAKVALEAIKGMRTMAQLSAAYGVHPTVIAQWKRQLMEHAAEVFARNGSGSGKSQEELTAPLYEEIGRLKVEVDWLKKKL
jgi:putative transposase